MTVARVPSTTYALFRQAVLEMKQVVFTHRGNRRVVCPIIIGHSDGREKVLAFQVGGESSGKLPNWRCFDLSEVEGATLREGRWAEGGSHRTTQTCVGDVDLDVNIHVRPRPK